MNTYNFIKNISAFLFVYIHDSLLIPAYVLIHFNDDYPLLTLNFKYINKNIINNGLLQRLQNNDIYTIFTSNKNVELKYNKETGIALLKNITKIQSDIIKDQRIIRLALTITNEFIKFIKSIPDYRNIFICGTGLTSAVYDIHNKKYLTLKKLLTK